MGWIWWYLSQPHFERVWGWDSHFPKWGTWSPPRLPKLQSSIARVKTPRIATFFYIIGKLLSCRCRKWARMSHLDICSTTYGKKKGRESNWQFNPRPLKVGNRPNLSACRWSATHHWKALDESYKFAWDLIPIGGLGKELWRCKVTGVQTETVSGLLLGSPGTKSHLDANAVERRKEYYMEEGGGFPRVRVVVSLVSPKLPVPCPSTKVLQNVN
jgi:hypothetical protein